MVEMTVQENQAIFDIQGTHKMWAFKKRLEIPLTNIVGIRRAQEQTQEFWKGWRVIGTHIPGVITAGTFHHNGKTIFWDATQGGNTIVVELMNEHYDELVIDVEDPDSIAQCLQAAHLHSQA
jgi:hypothetical protein